MTAPKQEKWAYENFDQLDVGHICSIGAVFDYYAGKVRLAPAFIRRIGLEWLFRLLSVTRKISKI